MLPEDKVWTDEDLMEVFGDVSDGLERGKDAEENCTDNDCSPTDWEPSEDLLSPSPPPSTLPQTSPTLPSDQSQTDLIGIDWDGGDMDEVDWDELVFFHSKYTTDEDESGTPQSVYTY